MLATKCMAERSQHWVPCSFEGGGSKEHFCLQNAAQGGGGVATGAGAALQENGAKHTGRGGGEQRAPSLKPRLPPAGRRAEKRIRP
jgi:hypothetical protein